MGRIRLSRPPSQAVHAPRRGMLRRLRDPPAARRARRSRKLSLPLAWDGTPDGLPEGYRTAFVASVKGHDREDGLLLDPWTRTHHRMGAQIIKPAPSSLVVTGNVAEWQQWAGISPTQLRLIRRARRSASSRSIASTTAPSTAKTISGSNTNRAHHFLPRPLLPLPNRRSLNPSEPGAADSPLG
jgi:hypothetical protein